MLDRLDRLAGNNIVLAEWMVGATAGAFTLFVGATLGVALFHPNEERSARAQAILRDLLCVFRPKGRR